MKTSKRSILLERATPYPWARDAKGNLIGANGHAIYFMGEDAVLVEYAPVMFEALHRILSEAAGPADQAKALRTIRRLAARTIAKMESVNEYGSAHSISGKQTKPSTGPISTLLLRSPHHDIK